MENWSGDFGNTVDPGSNGAVKGGGSGRRTGGHSAATTCDPLWKARYLPFTWKEIYLS
jgi:hypothetical protein